MRRAASEPGVIAFVYVGRLSYDKSVDEMLEAFDRALDVSDAASKVSQSVRRDPYHGAWAHHASQSVRQCYTTHATGHTLTTMT